MYGPLKDLKNYVDADDQLEFERLLRDGRKLATQKIKKIESNLNSIDRQGQSRPGVLPEKLHRILAI